MTSTPSNPQPIQIHIPPTLTHLSIPLSTFISAHPQYTNFAVGTFIFTPAKNNNRKLLLIQRASTERGFPSKWEIPGGSTEPTDPTLLHSAARKTFEETGLHLTKVVRQVGDQGVEFITGGGTKRWLKLSFEIEVEEFEGLDGERVEERVQVRLDPEEHQAFVWGSEEDVSMGKYDITTGEQKELILRAFEMTRRGDKGNFTRDIVGNAAAS
ncbi:hypothetical protein ACLMJK_005187 [Lecanora helva]